MAQTSWTTLRRKGENSSDKASPSAIWHMRSGKVSFQPIIDLSGNKSGTRLELEKNLYSYGSCGIKVWLSMLGDIG
jgi:hypothetical protein